VHALVVALALVACAEPTGPGLEKDAPFHDGVPVITALTWSCDADSAKWDLAVETEGWTGGGRLWIARDADDADKHDVYSDKADADGAWDCLSLDLDVVADWRDAQSGQSTAFPCSDQDALSYLFVAYTPDASETADCRAWGADGSLWGEVGGSDPCETALGDDEQEVGDRCG
jgi:hypothetical protein